MTGKSELPPEVIDILMKELAELIALVDEVRAMCEPDAADADRARRRRNRESLPGPDHLAPPESGPPSAPGP